MTKYSSTWTPSTNTQGTYLGLASPKPYTLPCPPETSSNPSDKIFSTEISTARPNRSSEIPKYHTGEIDIPDKNQKYRLFRVSAIEKNTEKLSQITVIKHERYREEKAAELANCFLSFSESMNCFKLVQLMYLVERESIIQDGYPVTHDDCYSIDAGVLLSNTWESLQGNTYDNGLSPIWSSFVGLSGDTVFSRKSFKLKKMSRSEYKLARTIFEEHGRKSLGDLKSWICDPSNLPERKPTNGFPLPISLESILSYADYSEEDIREILEEIELHQSARARFGV